MTDGGQRAPEPGGRQVVTAAELLEQPELQEGAEVVAGRSGLGRPIDHPRIQKSGLILVGHERGFVPTRVQVLGETETSFLSALDAPARARAVEALCATRPSLLMVTRGESPDEALVTAAERHGAPLVSVPWRSSEAIARVHRALDRLLAPTERLYGVLVEIHGLGTLLLGPSGIGKSECALFLVERGHRLVADDAVVLVRRPSGRLVGRPEPLLRHHLELRGVGILNVRELFGAPAVREECSVDLVVELCPWRQDEPYERLGLSEQRRTLLGVQVPMLRIPVRPGRDMAVILEVAARNELLKREGLDASRRFVERLSEARGVPLPPAGGTPAASDGERDAADEQGQE